MTKIKRGANITTVLNRRLSGRGMVVFLKISFKPHTSSEWIESELIRLGIPRRKMAVYFPNFRFSHILVEVRDEDEMYYCRAIKGLSPQVVSVSRA